jgi:hypothetical protein
MTGRRPQGVRQATAGNLLSACHPPDDDPPDDDPPDDDPPDDGRPDA